MIKTNAILMTRQPIPSRRRVSPLPEEGAYRLERFADLIGRIRPVALDARASKQSANLSENRLGRDELKLHGSERDEELCVESSRSQKEARQNVGIDDGSLGCCSCSLTLGLTAFRMLALEFAPCRVYRARDDARARSPPKPLDGQFQAQRWCQNVLEYLDLICCR
jgi:hypothetical protein